MCPVKPKVSEDEEVIVISDDEEVIVILDDEDTIADDGNISLSFSSTFTEEDITKMMESNYGPIWFPNAQPDPYDQGFYKGFYEKGWLKEKLTTLNGEKTWKTLIYDDKDKTSLDILATVATEALMDLL